MRNGLMLFPALLLASTGAFAQAPPAAPAAPQAPAAPRSAAAQTPKLLPPAPIPTPPNPPPAPPPPPVPSPPRQAINVRVDLTITEEGGGVPAVKKTVSTVAADGYSGSVRETASNNAPGSPGPVTLNFDAQPFIVPAGRGQINFGAPADRVRVSFSIQYTAVPSAGAEARPRTDIRLNLTPILENGKPLKVWEGADPIDRERRVSVEVTATILK